jgi:hypothetical protein
MDERRGGLTKADVIPFEDEMNGLSGEILNLELSEQLVIQNGNAEIIARALSVGVTVELHDSVLPKEDRAESEFDVTTLTAKQLYPRTESVRIVTGTIPPTSNTVANVAPGTPVTTDTIVLSEEEEIDPVFEEIDDEAASQTEEPLATQQNETIPYLSDAMTQLALTAAANANGLQAGLTTFSYNPLASLIENTKTLLLYYTAGNYANLNTELSGVSTDPLLAAEYKELQNSIGGNDGLSECVAQLDNFKDHTDRLSGLVLDSDSPNAEPTDDSTDDFLTLNDFSGGPTLIFTFNARKFRSAKYLIQASSDLTDRGHQATEIYILHDNHQAFTREVTSIYTQEPFVTFTTRLLNNNVEVFATSNVSNTNFVISGTRLQIAKASKSYAELSQQKVIELHELMAVYLDDGVDYVALCSASLLKPPLVANLARDFRDMLVTVSNGGFLTQSTAAKQAGLLQWAATLRSRRQEIQAQMDTDWNNFVETRRKAEAFDIAYNLTVAYTDESGNAIPSATLNSATIQAIESEA